MRKTLITAAAVAAPLMAEAAAPPPSMPFSFAPMIEEGTPDDPSCHPIPADWFNYVTNRRATVGVFPPYLGNSDNLTVFGGNVCLDFTPQDPRFMTGIAFIWVWAQGPNMQVQAISYEVDCINHTVQATYTGAGADVDAINRSVAQVTSAARPFSNDAASAYAISICRLIELFNPGRGDYPQ